jgi:hypothetical protein
MRQNAVMKRRLLPRAGVVAAVAVVLAGGAVAAFAATTQSSHHTRAHSAGAHRGAQALLTQAAQYLGVSEEQLRTELKGGKSLAQIADATPGKSASGLREALVSARKERLARVQARLPQRVSAQIERAGGPAAVQGPLAGSAGARAHARGALLARAYVGLQAAGYLGVSPEQLGREVKSGKTLAQIANATSGKSASGLEAALVSARKQRLAAAQAAGRITKAQEEARVGRLRKRVHRLVNRSLR